MGSKKPIETDYVRAMFWAAGRPVDDAFVAERRRSTDLAHALGLFEGGRLVGTLGMRTLSMRLPGGHLGPLAALGQGGVMPGHTVQGHSRRMVMQLMTMARERGFALAGGTMAEWPGFGRFGWGPATYARSDEIEARRARFRSDLPLDEGGRCELVSSAVALEHLPALHAASAEAGTNLVPRDAGYWSVVVERLERGESLDVLAAAGGEPAPFYALYRASDGTPEGIAIYRIDPRWKRGLSRTELDLVFFVHASDRAHFGMWRHLLTLAHVEKIHVSHGPVDDALTWLLVDGRRLENVGACDHIWLRLLDVREALRQRGSGLLSRTLVLRAVDDQFGETTTLKLEPGDRGRLEVSTTTSDPDVETNVSTLAALFLGGTALRPLLATRKILHRSDAALQAFTSLFTTTTMPFVDTEF